LNRNLAGNLSLGLGLLALVTSVFLVGAPIGLVGFVLGVIGLRRVQRREATNLSVAAAGTVFSAVGMLATIGLVLTVSHR
jgi:hypothetical protein